MQLTPELRLNVAQQQLYNRHTFSCIDLSYAETAILQQLLSQQGELVTKDALMQVGWPNRVVAPSSLQQCISMLRKKLADQPNIELKTVPRHGYLLQLPHQPSVTKPLARPSIPMLLAVALLCSVILGYLAYTQQQPQLHAYQERGLISTLSGVQGSFTLLTSVGDNTIDNDMATQRLHQQLLDQPSSPPPFNTFHGLALFSANRDSIAICPNYQEGQCPGNQLINISGDAERAGHLALSDFMSTKIRMEQKTYNKLAIPELQQHQGQLKEQMYHGDLYFSVQDNRLVRSDIRISLVEISADQGIFYFAACITDEDCYSTPTRYEIRGHFSRSSETWPQRRVERYDISINNTELSSPTALTDTAQRIYLALRKQHLTQKALTFYRLYQDDGTAIWQLPLAGDNLVWMQRHTLQL
ncbi:winged helix-turn-helix domain-containing protein [Shewanella algidipiscicola]|uniref:winged helix-turn-helix domain-containing protein n=1 Tax=Shewanella algidipiscicola TaxID=614070 RepID=UPI000D78BC67|nr:helix-turn-helix domain-containing protein [Shewanella algidipiscicola]